jgi:TFIIF-interacting CTD phosphatase-like protein
MSDKSKTNLILDLDQTLISAEATEEFNFNKYRTKSKLFSSYDMDGYFMVFSRPYLQKFLDYIFKNFNVSIWTAATKDYALFIINKIILQNRPNRKLDYIFFLYHCKWSESINNIHNSKKLSILWDIYKLPNYNINNTIILDDNDKIYESQKNNCIIAHPFEFTEKGSQHETFLKNLIPQLKLMKKRIKHGDNDLTTTINLNMKTLEKK